MERDQETNSSHETAGETSPKFLSNLTNAPVKEELGHHRTIGEELTSKQLELLLQAHRCARNKAPVWDQTRAPSGTKTIGEELTSKQLELLLQAHRCTRNNAPTGAQTRSSTRAPSGTRTVGEELTPKQLELLLQAHRCTKNNKFADPEAPTRRSTRAKTKALERDQEAPTRAQTGAPPRPGPHPNKAIGSDQEAPTGAQIRASHGSTMRTPNQVHLQNDSMSSGTKATSRPQTEAPTRAQTGTNCLNQSPNLDPRTTYSSNLIAKPKSGHLQQ